MARLVVCGLAEVEGMLGHPFTHIISIWASHAPRLGEITNLIKALRPDALLHVSCFDDIEKQQDGVQEPTREHVQDILAFTASADSCSSILVHCAAGISRSAAIAYAIRCQATAPGEENMCLDYLKSIRVQAAPNRLIVALADELLNRNGAMIQANESFLEGRYMNGVSDDEL